MESVRLQSRLAAYVNDDGNFILVVPSALKIVLELVRTRTRITGGLALEPKVLYLALGESVSQLRFVHGFEDEFEFEFEDD